MLGNAAKKALEKREAKQRSKILRQVEIIERLLSMPPAINERDPVHRLTMEVLRKIRLDIGEKATPPPDSPLLAAARKVIEARHYNGDDGWDKLKNAISELEGVINE